MQVDPSLRSPDRVALRLLQLLDGIEAAGFAPVSFQDLHGYAYLANLLAPLWDVDPLDGKVLKEGRPYYPELRQALDRMIYLGLVDLVDYEPGITDGKWAADGTVGLATSVARPLLDRVDSFSSERKIRDFLRRLGTAIAPVAEQLGTLVAADVTWTDNRTGRGDVLDFAEWKDANYSVNAAEAFDRLLPSGIRPSKGERLQFYVHLLERRAGTGDDEVSPAS